MCGIPLPPGLRMADRLPEPLYTPSTKAALGTMTRISTSQRTDAAGRRTGAQVREVSLAIYRRCAAYALERGIIIADTKFEFGTDGHGRLVLIDEILTPDSSRFWPADSYAPGTSPASFDKQYVRDYLETLDWDKTPPGPKLPAGIIERTAEKYREAQRRLTDLSRSRVQACGCVKAANPRKNTEKCGFGALSVHFMIRKFKQRLSV